MSLITRTITLQSVTAEKVQKLLNITPEEYGNIVLSHGIAYLRSQLGYNDFSYHMEADPMFWKWWRNHWHSVDMSFVDEAKSMTAADRALWYDTIHDVTEFAFTPPKVVMLPALKQLTQIIKHQL